MKPMLAASTDGSGLRYPVMVSPKLDGIRAMIVDGVVMSRKMIPIPNECVQELFGNPMLNGLDGELIVGKPTGKGVFNRTTRGVMTTTGRPDVTFYVFDDFTTPFLRFEMRLRSAQHRIKGHSACRRVVHNTVTSHDALAAREEQFLEAGYEGLMVRDPLAPYKQGRSTLKQGWLLKLKRFVDDEYEVVGYEERMHNSNEATTDGVGQRKRSTHKAGMIGRGDLGALVLRLNDRGDTFSCGTGFTDTDRKVMWATRHELIGKMAKVKHFEIGMLNKPRFPVFIGFRKD